MQEEIQERAQERVQEEARVQVSVVIIGRNEGERLARCVQSVRQAHWPAAPEVIYVDSGSSDGSPERAAREGASCLAIEPPYSAAAARNAGWMRARGEHVLFLDGDTELDPAFPALALQALRQGRGRVAAVWGHRRESAPRQSVYMRALDLDWIFPAGMTDFCGGDALFRRDALAAVGGFDASLIAGEEPELCRRLRAGCWRIQHIDAPMTLHDLGIRSFGQYWRRSVRAGHAYASVAQRFAGSADPLWLAESRRNVVHASVLAALVLLPLLAVAAAGWQAGLAAALGSLALFAAAVTRSALRHRWKAPGWTDAIIYGLHSHVQQVPVLVGQVGWWRRSRRDTPRTLIEYR